MALNQLHSYILCLNVSGQYTSGIFLDLQKAFDTVNANHKILPNKPKHYGIRCLPFRLFYMKFVE